MFIDLQNIVHKGLVLFWQHLTPCRSKRGLIDLDDTLLRRKTRLRNSLNFYKFMHENALSVKICIPPTFFLS